jgi:hypothetical protein
MMNLLWGKEIVAVISALAKLGVADHMDSEPATAEVLAAATGADAGALYRVMRLLASIEIFEELPGQRFALTPMGRCLRADAADSVRGVAMMNGDEWSIRACEYALHSIRTGENAIQAAYGKNAFEVLAERPAQLANFQLAMTGYSNVEVAVLDPILEFGVFTRLADVGGGHGALLAHILGKHPRLEGVLFDLPEVTSQACQSPALKPFHSRVSFETGSMFERVPHHCDAYIMKHIIHDWSDDRCHTILRLMCEQLASHAPQHGRVFLAEMIVPHGPEPAPAKFLDIAMLLHTPGGRERTVAEFAAMFEEAGLELVGVKTTAGPICLIEAKVAA